MISPFLWLTLLRFLEQLPWKQKGLACIWSNSPEPSVQNEGVLSASISPKYSPWSGQGRPQSWLWSEEAVEQCTRGRMSKMANFCLCLDKFQPEISPRELWCCQYALVRSLFYIWTWFLPFHSWYLLGRPTERLFQFVVGHLCHFWATGKWEERLRLRDIKQA